MEDPKSLTDRESVTVNIMKAIAVLSVIAAHVVPASEVDLLSKIISSAWRLFGKIGVVVFFVIGGFLYNRQPKDHRAFWKKKLHRIVIPWLFCATLTYGITMIGSWKFSAADYLKWIFGSGTWYYYVTVYLCFLFAFRWFYDKDVVLYCLIGIQVLAFALASLGVSTTPAQGFLTDYLNPLHWVGYFSLGILIRKHRLDRAAQKRKYIVLMAYLVGAAFLCVLYFNGIFTYFHIAAFVFCLAGLVVIADIAYRLANTKMARKIGLIGTSSYCIYLLHMQIVQGVAALLPDGAAKLIVSPFLGLGVMLGCISVGLLLCGKLPFGRKLKSLVGL